MKSYCRLFLYIALVALLGCNGDATIRSGGGDLIVSESAIKPAGQGTKFVFLGDVGRGNQKQAQISDHASKLIQDDAYDAVILLGDNIYGEGGDYAAESEELLFDPLKSIFETGISVYTILGNHDHNDNYDDDQINDPRLGMEGNQYYRLTDPDGLFSIYMLDSETLKKDKAQQSWLKKTLKTDNSKWLLCAMHTPPYSSDVAHRGSEDLAKIIEDITRSTKRFDVIFSGHNHIYERRMVPEMNTVAIIAGGSSRASDYDWPEDEMRFAFYDDIESFVTIEITEDQISGSAINLYGEEVDTFLIPAD